MPLSNDERGWVMTCLSGIACVVGASVICIDIIVRLIPSKRNFRIQDSDTFLSASLSLSFGVMLFSALYSMLPSSKRSLMAGGFSSKEASWILIVSFIGGVVGIQIISRIMHSFIPSHVVDCEHSHDEMMQKQNGQPHSHDYEDESDDHDHDHHDHHTAHDAHPQTPRSSLPGHIMTPSSGRRYLAKQNSYFSAAATNTTNARTRESEDDNNLLTATQSQPPDLSRRPTIGARVTTTLKEFTTSMKPACDEDGPCLGYTDPCGNECFKNVNARGGFRAPLNSRASNSMLRIPLTRNATVTGNQPLNESTPLLEAGNLQPRPQTEHLHEAPTRYYTVQEALSAESLHDDNDDDDNDDDDDTTKPQPPNGLHKSQTQATQSHHHHVPTNAFLSIGLQTSIAIALHKLPEGFITYATNHANPKLGVSVFLALFIHNITEGFAMALPLYLAINSRVKAMIISFVLGGLSQPIGAGVAAVWFKLAGKGDWAPSEAVYGGMFAVTAGIMASVALQLFSESLDLTHSRALCMVGAFSGMAILGMSSALTA